MPSFNDLNLDKWKELDIWTDSLWLISQRDKSGKHDGFYHGNFVPQIPHQLILRYTKKDEVVFDPFVGSGTTIYEAEALGRNSIGVDIQPELTEHIKGKISDSPVFSEVVTGDSTNKKTLAEVEATLQKHKKKSVQLVILHPPYGDIIKFSKNQSDLSNCSSLKDFLSKFSQVLKNSVAVLENKRYLAIVIGDKYAKGQWIPLSFYCMYEAQKLGLVLKSIVIKNMEGNRAKQNKEAIWKYRALSSDYNIFKHEYIFIFKKVEEEK